MAEPRLQREEHCESTVTILIALVKVYGPTSLQVTNFVSGLERSSNSLWSCAKVLLLRFRDEDVVIC